MKIDISKASQFLAANAIEALEPKVKDAQDELKEQDDTVSQA